MQVFMFLSAIYISVDLDCFFTNDLPEPSNGSMSVEQHERERVSSVTVLRTRSGFNSFDGEREHS